MLVILTPSENVTENGGVPEKLAATIAVSPGAIHESFHTTTLGRLIAIDFDDVL